MMHRRYSLRQLSVLALVAVCACSTSEAPDEPAGGGAAGTGGTSDSGGNIGAGGTSSSGGSAGTGTGGSAGSSAVGELADYGPYVGAVTDSAAAFAYRLKNTTQVGAVTRVRLSTSSNLGSSPIYSSSVTVSTTNDYTAKTTISGLTAATRYHFGIEVDGELQAGGLGSFRTFPAAGTRTAFKVAFGNSVKDTVGRPEQSGINAALSAHGDMAFFMCTGDLFYDDITKNDVSLFRTAYRRSLSTSPMRTMASMVPFAFMWDDHDFGPDNSDKNASGKPASLLVYRERIPHYPVGTGPIQQAFSVGKVRFILTDLRSEREPNSTTDSASKTMMGTEQKAWFKSELLAAKSTHDLTIWVSTVPYVAAATSGGDHWGGFTTERTEIADYLKSNGISNIFIISGDAHCLAANNGLNADYATGGGMPIPEALASPLDGDDTKPKGGPWSEGTYMPPLGENVYGLVEISYPTNKVKLTYRGIDNKQVERLTYAKEWSLP